jgi:hypothetical protein
MVSVLLPALLVEAEVVVVAEVEEDVVGTELEDVVDDTDDEDTD